MARISLLLSLALVLTIGSVSAHPQNTLSPSTLSELQTFPYTELSNLIEKNSQSAPNTPQFKALFAICKAYNDYLGAFKVASAKDLVGSVHTKYALMTKAMLEAKAYVGVKGELSIQLRKSYAAMAQGYVKLVVKTAEISAKYKFDANAKISEGDKKDIDRCLIKLRDSINVFVRVISQCSEKFSGGGNVLFDAAGKAKFDGGKGFRSLNHHNKIHLE